MDTQVKIKITNLAISLVLTTFGEQAREIQLSPPDCFSSGGTCELSIDLCTFTFMRTHIPLSPQFAMSSVQNSRLLPDWLIALWIHCTMMIERDMFEGLSHQSR